MLHVSQAGGQSVVAWFGMSNIHAVKTWYWKISEGGRRRCRVLRCDLCARLPFHMQLMIKVHLVFSARVLYLSLTYINI